jgi:hypothetical protein
MNAALSIAISSLSCSTQTQLVTKIDLNDPQILRVRLPDPKG